jgi:hypothetical protein
VSGRVVLQRPGSIQSVALYWFEWRDIAAMAWLYGWRGVPDADRMSAAEASDLAIALERARMSPRLRELSAKVIPVARAGGINLLRGH